MCIECVDQIYGCNRCTRETNRNGVDGFVTCLECTEGFFLLQNKTHVDDYPSVFATCVHDCKKAHASYINDPATGKCSCNVDTP